MMLRYSIQDLLSLQASVLPLCKRGGCSLTRIRKRPACGCKEETAPTGTVKPPRPRKSRRSKRGGSRRKRRAPTSVDEAAAENPSSGERPGPRIGVKGTRALRRGLRASTLTFQLKRKLYLSPYKIGTRPDDGAYSGLRTAPGELPVTNGELRARRVESSRRGARRMCAVLSQSDFVRFGSVGDRRVISSLERIDRVKVLFSAWAQIADPGGIEVGPSRRSECTLCGRTRDRREHFCLGYPKSVIEAELSRWRSGRPFPKRCERHDNLDCQIVSCVNLRRHLEKVRLAANR